jgi:hypothetical protein
MLLGYSQTVRKPQTAKAAKKKYVPPWSRFASILGDTSPMILSPDIRITAREG